MAKKMKTINIEYDEEKDDYEIQIERGLRKHGYRHGDVNIICKPKPKKRLRKNSRKK